MDNCTGGGGGGVQPSMHVVGAVKPRAAAESQKLHHYRDSSHEISDSFFRHIAKDEEVKYYLGK